MMRREHGACPHCGQRMLMRHGVHLPPKLADLFDTIERTGEAGISTEVLRGVLYPGKSTRDARNCVKAQVYHLNDLLAETDIEVRASSHDPYYKVKKRTKSDKTRRNGPKLNE
jgi:hypothetical protein